MKISRRNFVRIGALTPLVYGFPFSTEPGNAAEMNSASAASLYQNFQNPPASARPFMRWWWNGGRVVEKELLRELDLLKEKGISGVEINPVAFPKGGNPLNYKVLNWLSEEWLAVLKTTLIAAKERGITCDLIVGSGWPFGGEFLKKEEQIQLLALGTKNLKGPQQFSIKKQDLLAETDFLMKRESGSMELFGLRLSSARLDAFHPGVDLNSQIKNAEVTIDVPPGEHILYIMVKLTGYASVTLGAPGASGPVLDHYNKAAVLRYLDRMSDAISGKIGHMAEYFRSIFVDSLELRGSNWCDDMLEQFKQRRGYSLEPYLPFILFKLSKRLSHTGSQSIERIITLSSQTQDEINQVRYDFETTRLELFNERFLYTFIDWCKKNKVKSRVQAYGREYYTLESAMLPDIPECETWIRDDVGGDLPENTFKTGRAYRPVNKFVSSAARLTGKRMISCEEMTNTDLVFNESLERIKIVGDQSNLSGVTHSILHGFNYSPPDVPFPGWVRYGTFFSERNPWWPYLKTWIDYKARLSAVFQDSEMQSDIAIMFPLADMWSEVGLQYQQVPQIVYPAYANNIWEAIHQNGGGCDYINENILQKCSFSKGRFHYNTRSYKVLFMTEMESVAPETPELLRKFAAAGGLLIFIGKEPVKSFGKQNAAARDQKVYTEIQSLKKDFPRNISFFPAPKGKIIDWYTQLQLKYNLTPFVKFDKPVSHVSQVHYKTGEAAIFFISNYHLEKTHEFTATFNVRNRTAWLWDPETGKKYLYPYQDVKNKLRISLNPAQSMLIVFTNDSEGELYKLPKVAAKQPYTINGPWDVTLEKGNEQPRKTEFKKLIDFKDDPELQSFGGVIFYEQTFLIESPEHYHSLDLGKVSGISELEVNGQPLGFRWYGKHSYDLKGTLKPGENSIKIKVTTVLGNYMKSLKNNPVAQQWTHTKAQPFYSAGLMGPVSLV
ncbi:glycosyl hydrolase [Pedobacter heparinus]|uniref:glycosyl hydrolase n=1 Tax=Pedobacter heparinus TaxID=984 RepID=UPI0029314A82|nr:glycosyl hydrolase [Pedobacter heparinus]